MTVKFNGYFEFPRELDMAPFTAAHLAKVEGWLLPTLFTYNTLSLSHAY